jgi:hypothetical protein
MNFHFERDNTKVALCVFKTKIVYSALINEE